MTFRFNEPEQIRVPKLDEVSAVAITMQKQVLTVAELNAMIPEPGLEAYCSDEAGGFVRVFADGGNWRRITDRAIISA